MKADTYFREFDETNIMHLVHTFSFKGAVHQAIQVLKPYKCDKNITWVYAITGRLRQEVNNHSHFLATSYSSLESIYRVFNLH